MSSTLTPYDQTARETMRDQLVHLTHDAHQRAKGYRARKTVLAVCFGVSPSYISKLLSDAPPNVTPETCERIANRIGLRFPYFTTEGANFTDNLIPRTPFIDQLREVEHAVAGVHGLMLTKAGSPALAIEYLRETLEVLPLVQLARMLDSAPRPENHRELASPVFEAIHHAINRVDADLAIPLQLFHEDSTQLFREMIGMLEVFEDEPYS